jgi:hypothetical protein
VGEDEQNGTVGVTFACRAVAARVNFPQPASRQQAESERVFAEVPAIIEPQAFEQVQSVLKARNSRITAPRFVAGPILFTGLAAIGPELCAWQNPITM